MVASKIGYKRRAHALAALVTILSSAAALIANLLLWEGAEVFKHLHLRFSCAVGRLVKSCKRLPMNPFSIFRYISVVLLTVASLAEDKGPTALSNLFLSFFHLSGILHLFTEIQSQLIILSGVLS